MTKRRLSIRAALLAILLLVIALVDATAASAKTFEFSDYLPDGAECYMPTIGNMHQYDGVTYICTATTEPRTKRKPSDDTYVYYEWKKFGVNFRELKRTDADLCITVSGSSRNDGAAVVQRPCVDSDHSQWWTQAVDYLGSGLLINYHSGKCLSVAHGSLSGGAPLVQATCRGSDHSMQWTSVPVGSSARFTNYHSGLVISMGGNESAGRPLYQSRYTGAKSQLWASLPLV
jgi:hypothetical protein